MKNFNPIVFIQIAVMILVLYIIYKIFSGVKNIFATVGSTFNTSASEQEAAAETTYDDVQYLDPTIGFKVLVEKGYSGQKINNYFDKIKFRSNDADNVAKLIHDSFGAFNDNEAQVYNAFQSIPTKVAVSLVAHRYKSIYGKDLRSVLTDKLNTSEVQTVIKIISKKPKL
ncbi:MAG: hypothetical protein KatS3mg027_2501 [Bacteroidia bacterium]|nr:MAG: hypothetical protein KatS3mg027_2501 [Bacteroidia bacterium]